MGEPQLGKFYISTSVGLFIKKKKIEDIIWEISYKQITWKKLTWSWCYFTDKVYEVKSDSNKLTHI